MKKLLLPLLAIACLQAQNGGRIHSVKVTVLSTMLADDGIGEWGFSALVTTDGDRFCSTPARVRIRCWRIPAR